MRNIVLARVDDRLIHGEVVTSFIPYHHADHVVIVDDTVANDKFNCRVLQMVAPKGVTVEIYTVEKGIEALNTEKDENETVIALAKTPITFERLIDAGLKIDSINIGGMASKADRKPFIRNCAASDEEVKSMAAMSQKGVELYYRLVADQQKIDLKNKL